MLSARRVPAARAASRAVVLSATLVLVPLMLSGALAEAPWTSEHGDPGRTRARGEQGTGEGEVAWTRSFEERLGVAATAPHRVFIGQSGVGRGLTALDAATGDTIWTLTRGGVGGHAGPVVAGDRVYVAAGVEVMSVNATTGRMEWSAWTEEGCCLHWPAYDDGVLYTGAGEIVALDPRDHPADDVLPVAPFDKSPHVLWQYDLPGHVTGLVAAEGVVYASLRDGVYAVTAEASVAGVGRSSPRLLWHFPVEAPSEVAVSGGRVVFDASSTLFALDALTGGVIWAEHAVPSYPRQPPVVRDGVVYWGRGEPTPPGNASVPRAPPEGLIALNAVTGEKVWEKERCHLTHPLVVDANHVIAGCNSRVTALSRATGAHVWAFEWMPPMSSFTVGDGVLYVAAGWNGTLQGYSLHAIAVGGWPEPPPDVDPSVDFVPRQSPAPAVLLVLAGCVLAAATGLRRPRA